MNKAGIDYAISTPAICISENNELFWYFFTDVKKQVGPYSNNIFGIHYSQSFFEKDLERFDWLSEQVIQLLKKQSVSQVQLEGYSMNSKSSRIFQIGENTGILKKKLKDNFFPFYVIAPTSIKKFATGKGNSNKEEMVSAFVNEINFDIFETLSQNTIKKPLEDIVDSYFILKYTDSN